MDGNIVNMPTFPFLNAFRGMPNQDVIAWGMAQSGRRARYATPDIERCARDR